MRLGGFGYRQGFSAVCRAHEGRFPGNAGKGFCGFKKNNYFCNPNSKA